MNEIRNFPPQEQNQKNHVVLSSWQSHLKREFSKTNKWGLRTRCKLKALHIVERESPFLINQSIYQI